MVVAWPDSLRSRFWGWGLADHPHFVRRFRRSPHDCELNLGANRPAQMLGHDFLQGHPCEKLVANLNDAITCSQPRALRVASGENLQDDDWTAPLGSLLIEKLGDPDSDSGGMLWRPNIL
jgi:hypothetical protein